MPDKFLVIIGGPTGVGKTDVSLALARHYHTEIINADSRQVYAELTIGVGKPTTEELNSIPHHLIGHISIHQHYSAGQFAKDALAKIDFLFVKKNIVIVSGGTGLYLNAILQGLDEFPEIPNEVVDRWTTLWREEGVDVLMEKLKKLDPDYAASVDSQNPMRLLRALSVSEFTGKPFSSFQLNVKKERAFTAIPILLERPREELYDTINQRVLKMMDQGWMEEARSLLPWRTLKSLNTVGYKELFQVLTGAMTWEEAVPLIQQTTRNYAKRQITWWRHQGEWRSFSPNDVNAMIKMIDEDLKAEHREQSA